MVDDGQWQVETETSVYYVDVELKSVMRRPNKGSVVLVNDGKWFTYTSIIECAVGQPFRFTFLYDGQVLERIATNVTKMEKA